MKRSRPIRKSYDFSNEHPGLEEEWLLQPFFSFMAAFQIIRRRSRRLLIL